MTSWCVFWGMPLLASQVTKCLDNCDIVVKPLYNNNAARSSASELTFHKGTLSRST